MAKFLELWNKEGPYTVELSGPILQAAASTRESAQRATKEYIERRKEFFQNYSPSTDNYSIWSEDLRSILEQGNYNPAKGVVMPDQDTVDQFTHKYIHTLKLIGTRDDVLPRELFKEVPQNTKWTRSEGGALGPQEILSWLLKAHNGEQRLVAGQWKKCVGSPFDPPASQSWIRSVSHWPDWHVIKHLERRTAPCDEDPWRSKWDELYTVDQIKEQVARGSRPALDDIVNSLFAKVRDEHGNIVEDLRWVRAMQVWTLPQLFQDFGNHHTARNYTLSGRQRL
jgi:hypothetical protein